MATEVEAELNVPKIVSATCIDPEFPPQNVLDSDEKSMWMTTGLYPQELVLSIPHGTSLSKVRTVTLGVTSLEIQYTDGPTATNFTSAARATSIEDTEGQAQMTTLNFTSSIAPTYLKLIIHKGSGPFSAVRYIDLSQ